MDTRISRTLITTRGVLAGLLVLCFASTAQADPRMYTGSLIIEAFITSSGSPLPTGGYGYGIPLEGVCNTAPYHAKETVTFGTIMFTVPAYAGQVATIDTNNDGSADYPAGCLFSTVLAGDPLTGSGILATSGRGGDRAASDPRAISFSLSQLNKVKSGASFNLYNAYKWEVHIADLHNRVGTFAKNGGDGAFAVVHGPGIGGTRKAVVTETPGGNKFGGTMQLLGFYGDNEGAFDAVVNDTFVAYFDWLFDYLGAGNGGKVAGVVTKGFKTTTKNYGNFRANGQPVTSVVEVEAFGWTTGNVTVTGKDGPPGSPSTLLVRNGYDNRDGKGSGTVQLVTPMLTRWDNGTEPTSTVGIGILNIQFAPEPSQWLMLGSGVGLMGILFATNRRK